MLLLDHSLPDVHIYHGLNFVIFDVRLGIGNESLHEISNDNGIRVVNSATSKNLRVKSMMFPHHNIHKYAWTSSDGKTIFW
jgi:hypothetical protein